MATKEDKQQILLNLDELLEDDSFLDDSDSESEEDYSSYFESMASLMDFEDKSSVVESVRSRVEAVVPEENSPIIAKRENEAVFAIKTVVFAVLTMTAIGVSALVYFYVSSNESNDFEVAFQDNSFKVLEFIALDLARAMTAMDALVVSMMASAKLSGNSSWPFQTISDQATRMAKTRSLTKALVIEQYQFVNDDIRKDYEEYAFANSQWIDEAITVTQTDPGFHGLKNVTEYNVSRSIFFGQNPLPDNSGPYTPTWQSYPVVPVTAPYNLDVSRDIDMASGMKKSREARQVVISKVLNLFDTEDTTTDDASLNMTEWASSFVGPDSDPSEPLVKIFFPIIDSLVDLDSGSEEVDSVVGTMAMSFYWKTLFGNFEMVPSELHLVIVVENECNQTFTYKIDGLDATYLGQGDLHDSTYDDMGIFASADDLKNFGDDPFYTGPSLAHDYCSYHFRIYPTVEMQDEYTSADPIMFTVAVIAVFVFTSATFTLYDMIVAIKQEKIIQTAEKGHSIVSSLFPSNVRDRLFDEEMKPDTLPTKARMKNFLSDSNGKESHDQGDTGVASRPIADLFPETTVMFADIAGFTAWSSSREPPQVFCLLETLYGAFDAIAAKRGVFKVETIGDSYVAVTGLPEPRKDHAIVMVRFARDIRAKFAEITQNLEVTLGPDTCDLKLRFGLHSGPVTAGVLRGQKSRFQLFGDTVNTASRMESTGTSNRIQVSQSTADILKEANKGAWLHARRETIEVKGKGMMQTYWVEPRTDTHAGASDTTSDEGVTISPGDQRLGRLIDWNTDILGRLMKLIIARRKTRKLISRTVSTNDSTEFSSEISVESNTMPINEVREVIELPEFERCTLKDADIDAMELDPEVKSELHDYVAAIAETYRDNPFHNFEHASHVGMSVAKLLSRIVAPDIPISEQKNHNGDVAHTLHDHTYGITSDPLTQFACVFAALIHDVDHDGVGNDQLVKEKTPIALHYNGKSVAEQNSIDIAWQIFNSPKYSKLRDTICATPAELTRFRQLVVNSVMATDIMDKDLKKLRNQRWDKAFSQSSARKESSRRNRNRKATIVIEHLIQASDVSHTMQHWHVYRKWNERLFFEMSKAYQAGRFPKDPADFWYKGEIGFLDLYIIPLARKLSDCGVFGVSSDEYLNYAMRNREEWERTGKEIVAEMVEKLKMEQEVLSSFPPRD